MAFPHSHPRNPAAPTGAGIGCGCWRDRLSSCSVRSSLSVEAPKRPARDSSPQRNRPLPVRKFQIEACPFCGPRQNPYTPPAMDAEWRFSQENATLHDLKEARWESETLWPVKWRIAQFRSRTALENRPLACLHVETRTQRKAIVNSLSPIDLPSTVRLVHTSQTER